MQVFSIFSFFSGAGFLDLGFEKAGFSIVSVNEFSPAFLNAYRYARSRMGIQEPKYGYSKDINEFLETRSCELRKNIQEERKNNSLIGFIGGPLALIFLLQESNGERKETMESYPNHTLI